MAGQAEVTMDRKRETAPEIEGLVATKVTTWSSWNGSSQTWQYHHGSDWRPDGRMVRVSQALEDGKTYVWKGVGDAEHPIILHDMSDAEIVEAVKRLADGHIVDMSSDAASQPARTAARKLAAWCRHEGRIMHAILTLDQDGKSVVDYDDAPVTYPHPDRPVAVVVSWNVHDAFPLVGHETIAPNLDAAIDLVRRGLVPIPDIAEHGFNEAEIDLLDEDDSLEGIRARDEFWNRTEYRQVDFDYAELVRGANPSP
jgi:hypothetical protein